MTSNYRGLKAAVVIVLSIAVIGGLASRWTLGSWWTRIATTASAAAAPINAPELAAAKDSLTLPADVSKRLAVRTEPVRSSIAPTVLDLSGTLMLDPDRLSHVHARFPGEIVELGPGDGRSSAVCFGQHVHKGQLLAVIWSQDLGEKKSELIDALSQIRVDDDSLAQDHRGRGRGFRARPRPAGRDGARSRRTALPSPRPSERCKPGVFPRRRSTRCARRPIGSAPRETPEREEMVSQWAKLEVRAPLDGTVIERNVALGELVDTSTDLFKLADLTRLGVLAHAYEEDLPTLDSLPPSQRAWSVTVGAGRDAATRIGRFDQVGCIIDPNQHTALVMGWVDNLDGKLRVGQFVKTRLEIPSPPGEVVVPASALSEEGDRTYVFVQSDGKSTYARRQVAVVRRAWRQGVHPQPTRTRTKEPRNRAAGAGRTSSRDADRGVGRQPRRSEAKRRHTLRLSKTLMINRLVHWAVHNRLVVILLAAGLMAYGIYAFYKVNVEAYPDPAPAIVEVVARYPGASAEEVERQVTIPLEVALAGMPGLNITRTQSLFELCHVSCQFEYGPDPMAARQEVLNRLSLASLPAGVTPDISPRSPTGEIFRYVLVGPKDAAGHDIYDPNDLKSLQDNTLERLFRRLPHIAGRLQLRRHGETLRDSSRPGADTALRHRAAAT